MFRYRIFIANQDQFSLDLPIPRLEARIRVSSSNPQGVHPSLVNAIGLVACSMFGPEVEGFEGLFLRQARQTGSDALSMLDRIVDYFVAQILEGYFLLRMGRLQEAYVLSSSESFFVTPLPIRV